MSLPVGTLVMLVRLGPESGRVGTIISPLALHYGANSGLGRFYGVDFPRNPSCWPGGGGLPRGAWCVAPEHVIPILPPGTLDDVTTDEPISEVA